MKNKDYLKEIYLNSLYIVVFLAIIMVKEYGWMYIFITFLIVVGFKIIENILNYLVDKTKR